MNGQIVQVSISLGGVPKRPAPSGVLGPLGIEGDRHAHPNSHGGPQKAVLIVTAESVDELIAQGFPVFYGALGENLTVRGVDRRWLRPGQRWRAGQAVIELTRPRVPCSALTVYDLPRRPLQQEIWDDKVQAGETSSPVWAKAGFYGSVCQPGEVRPGNPFVLLQELA